MEMLTGSSNNSGRELTAASSIFRFLVLLISFTSVVVAGQLNAKLNSNGVYVSRDELHNKNVLGVTTGFGILVVATRSRIHFYEDNEERRTVGSVALDMQSRTKFFELKLFSKSEIFYCDDSNCGLCTYSGMTSSCSKIALHDDEPRIAEIISASAVKMENMEQLLLTISFKNVEGGTKMLILRYNAQDNGNVLPVANYAEASFIQDQHVLTGFEKDGFVYFVTTSLQIFEPDLFLHDQSSNQVTVTKIIRICSADQTPDLASKISVLVGCDQEYQHLSSRGETAVYDQDTGQVYIMMFNHTSMGHGMCRFKLSNLNKRFSSIWQTCQEVSFSEIPAKTNKCKYPSLFDVMRKKEGCLIYSRLDDELSPTLCARFGRDQPLDNCQLHKVKSDTYRYGWLEDYNVMQGELMMKVSENPFLGSFESLIIDNKAFFAAVSGGPGIEDVIRFTASDSADFEQNWKSNISSAEKFSIAKIQGNRLLYATVEGLQSTLISCKELYPSCNALRLGGWSDPLDCSWCADGPMFRTISAEEADGCQNKMKYECSPEMRWIHKYNNNSGFTALGDGFKALKNPKLNACGVNCAVTQVEGNTIQCDTNADDAIDDNCRTVYLSGTIGGKNYSFPFDYTQSDRGTQTDIKSAAAEDKKGSSPGWKVAIAILSVMTIIVIVALIVYYMRNRFPRIKTHARPTMPQRVENEYDLGHLGMGRATQLSINGDGYVNVFRSMRPELKIDFKNLRVNKFESIGQGHYGVVYKAVYAPPKKIEEKVVCKYLKDGKISEFYDEARIMSEFQHPNILKLIGVALDEASHFPIIVTEYMAGGDLKTHISNEENTIKMRDLFEFAYDIAKGMEYIHSMNYIHRDLASRNCLLDDRLRVKIADFGLCRKVNMQTQLYEQMHERDLPVRWFPPEIVEIGFGISSDIWSFGIVIWELFTRGATPYKQMSWSMLLPWLKESEANRLQKPPYCPDKLYTNVMLACWRADPSRRPSFSELVHIIPELVKYMEGYDRSQLHAGYERVSSRFLTLSPQDQAYPIYQNESTLLMDPNQPSTSGYVPSSSSLAELFTDCPSSSTSIPMDSVSDPSYQLLSNCSETTC
uniref:receptor protein-tyrosine kinase n=1 Tax=Caenorhabditis japonica TaxID=281687 RepID=A0A8R1HU05_CAEJA